MDGWVDRCVCGWSIDVTKHINITIIIKIALISSLYNRDRGTSAMLNMYTMYITSSSSSNKR